ncbi:hypothetical protein L6164_008343 [Bauhinia variegata]|uniref:Uncharacterized protein n=1 Tax=Bauhinia variegata TaxID=167791 RepID=A0ACB9PJ90_BAUVA|nr:hypothetical protein L6164_008343 [Bauhinia variegata]
MVKLTIIGRVSDGLPLAQGPRFMNEENGYLSCYKEQAEFILRDISRGSLAPTKMTIRIHHNCFNYLVENGVFFIVLCDSSYPRKLAFHYLQDLKKEFEKFDETLIGKITRPYSFVRFDGIIANIRRQYIDTRTQANLSKLNANWKEDLDIVTEDMAQILERRRNSEIVESLPASHQSAPSIWASPLLEVIALKWTPILIVAVVSAVLLWATLVLTEDSITSSW